MSTAAEAFVEQRNRNIRATTAEKDSVEAQISINEQWAIDQEKAINAETLLLQEEGKLSELGIEEVRQKSISKFEDEAKKRIENGLSAHLDALKNTFVLPEQATHITEMLINKFVTLSGDERMKWFKDARTGQNEELALALLRGPETLTKLSDDAREAMTDLFRTQAEQAKAERHRDIRYRADAVITTFDTVRRRLRT